MAVLNLIEIISILINKGNFFRKNKTKDNANFSACVDENVDEKFVLEPSKCKSIFDAVQRTWLSISANLSTNEANFEVIAAFVVMSDVQSDYAKVVGIGTGNSCISAKYLVRSMPGEALLDLHAEVIARRSFQIYLYETLIRIEENKFNDNSELILQRYTDENGIGHIRIKSHLKVYLYISETPCGDARSDDLTNSQSIARNFQKGILRKKYELMKGTVPLPPNYMNVMDGLKSGEQCCAFNSCSDKIVKWNVLGVQGTLLSAFVEPIYLSGIVVSNGYHYESMSRAFYDRIDIKLFQSKLAPNLRFHLNCPKIGCCEEKIDNSKQGRSKHSVSHNWYLSFDCELIISSNVEMVNANTGTVYCKKNRFSKLIPERIQTKLSRLAKKSMINFYVNLVSKYSKHPSIQLNLEDQLDEDDYLKPLYFGKKKQMSQYKTVQYAFEETLKESNLGEWIHAPIQINLFDA